MERYDYRPIRRPTWLPAACALVLVAVGLLAAETVAAAGGIDEPPAQGSPDAPITIVEYGDFL